MVHRAILPVVATPADALSDERFVEVLRPSFAALPSTVKSIDWARLKDVVCTYVDDAKRLGWSPERVVFILKTAAREAGLPVALPMPFHPRYVTSDPRVIVMVRWCIKRYFHHEASSDTSSV